MVIIVFCSDGYTPDKRVVILSDTSQEFNFERLYNQITDGFTVEWKNGQKYVMDPDESPKLVITTNFTINSISRSDKRRQFFTSYRHLLRNAFGYRAQDPC